MSITQNVASAPRQSLRLWPGAVAAVMLGLVGFVIPLVAPQARFFDMPTPLIGMLGAVVCGLLIVVWWLFFSRAPWSERLSAIVVMVAAVAATSLVVHPSISNGMMGMMLYLYSIPILGLALVVWATASRGVSSQLRRASMFAAIGIACGTLMLIRTDGVSGEGVSDIHWRWTPTAEERLLAQAKDEPFVAAEADTKALSTPPAVETPEEPTPPAAAKIEPTAPAAAETPTGPALSESGSSRVGGRAMSEARFNGVEWPGFRGPARDGVIRGLQINTDWSRTPPVEMWRRPIGPGWSSFAVAGDVVYTQEQRGEDEIVSAYNLKTGVPVWRHRDAIRFYESNGGPGPRGTPTVHNGRVYTMGATGVLNALDAGSGAKVWSRNATTDTGVTVPDWGIASSPLVIDDVVIVAVSGQLVAYDVGTGDQRWLGPKGGAGYSSPHLVTIDGVAQIVLLRGSRTISVAPADGTLLWEHTWQSGVGIVQPALAPDGDLLITVGDAMGGLGMRRLAVKHGTSGWTVEERWTSRGLKPYFNDFVVHEGHAFGFDGSILASINLTNGERAWKGGRYGHGQMVLLPEQDLLLVLSEDGELALVSATPDKFTEVARVPALNSKTWNHPVLIGDVLLVRNGEEMAAFRLPLAGRLISSAPR
jgi:outer membrane protein assembly factor BamB